MDKRTTIIKYCIGYKDETPVKVAKKLNISTATLYRRIKNPSTMPLGDLGMIVRGVPLTQEQKEILIGGGA